MGTPINARYAKITCLALIYALAMATCHAAVPNGDQGLKIRDSIPSMHPNADAITSEKARTSRKLLGQKGPVTWTTLWADEFDSWDSNKWSYQFGDGCQINLCGWGNQELVGILCFYK